MGARRFDVLVVGAGPAGSTAALVLARAGARVGLVDKARFPRDKACGDLIGPRGLQVLADLGVPEPPGLDVGDMVVVGPTNRRVVLPCFDGATYPGRARAVTRYSVRRCAAHGRARCRRRTRRGPRRRPPLVRCRSRRLRGRRRRRAARRLRHRGRRCDQPCRAGRLPGRGVTRACGGSPCAATSTSTSTCRPSHCGNRTAGAPFPATAGSSPAPTAAPTSASGSGPWRTAEAGAAAVQRLPAFVEHLVRLGLLDGRRRRRCRAGWGVGSRWAWSGRRPPPGGAAGRRRRRIGQSPPG